MSTNYILNYNDFKIPNYFNFFKIKKFEKYYHMILFRNSVVNHQENFKNTT